jgi:hypothetical protein
MLETKMRLPTLLIALATTACAAIPNASQQALRTTDPATTDLAALRAAVDMPDALRPQPGTTRLAVQLGSRTGHFALEEDEAASRAARQDAPPAPGRRIAAFRLTPAAREEMEDFRRSAAARRMTIGIAADACRAGPVDAGPLVIGTWLSTAQTGRFVALAQFDLRRLAGEAAIAALPPCIPPGADPA